MSQYGHSFRQVCPYGAQVAPHRTKIKTGYFLKLGGMLGRVKAVVNHISIITHKFSGFTLGISIRTGGQFAGKNTISQSQY